MPLAKGPGTIRRNISELMGSPIRSQARKKAINTIAQRRNISRDDALFVNARAIAINKARQR